jgi:DNA polymerase-3 subunit chi
VLPTLLELSPRGWRAAVQAASEERVEALNTLLWTYREESFLPHGTARWIRFAHPIYLTTSDDNPNAAQVRFLVDGGRLPTPALFPRRHVFDGRDAEAVSRARAGGRRRRHEATRSAIGGRMPTGAGSGRRSAVIASLTPVRADGCQRAFSFSSNTQPSCHSPCDCNARSL